MNCHCQPGTGRMSWCARDVLSSKIYRDERLFSVSILANWTAETNVAVTLLNTFINISGSEIFYNLHTMVDSYIDNRPEPLFKVKEPWHCKKKQNSHKMRSVWRHTQNGYRGQTWARQWTGVGGWYSCRVRFFSNFRYGPVKLKIQVRIQLNYFFLYSINERTKHTQPAVRVTKKPSNERSMHVCHWLSQSQRYPLGYLHRQVLFRLVLPYWTRKRPGQHHRVQYSAGQSGTTAKSAEHHYGGGQYHHTQQYHPENGTSIN